MIKQEWKNIIKKPFLIVVIVAIMLVPMFYSLIFLSAYWNPYGKLDQLPVAVVNNDRGAVLDGKTINIGKDFVDGLKDDDKFKWVFTTERKAMEGLKNEDYYMVIELPSQFSQHASSLLGEHPEKMELNYYTNAGKNYSGSQISSSAIKDISSSLSKKVTEQYADSVFKSLSKVGEGMQEASDGSKRINEGVDKLANGTTTLSENLKKLTDSNLVLKDGTAKLQAGAIQVANGIKQSSDGANQLNTGIHSVLGGADSLKKGAGDLNSGLQQLSEASKKLVAGSDQLLSGNNQLAAGLKQSSDGSVALQNSFGQFTNNISTMNTAIQDVTNELSDVSSTGSISQEEIKKVLAQLQTISTSMDQLNQGGKQISTSYSQLVAGQHNLYSAANRLVAGQKEFNSNSTLFNGKLGEAVVASQKLAQGSIDLFNGTKKVSEGSSSLSSGLVTLNSGGDQIVEGINQLSDGSNQLYIGSGKLADGANELLKGTHDLSQGTSTLHKSLQDGANKVNDVSTNDETNTMFASPINLVAHKLNDVKDYGVGLAPYILSLGLLAGGLMFVSSYSMRTTTEITTSGFSHFISKYSVLLVVGVFQSIFADVILIHGLGLQVQNELYFYLFTIFTSLTLYTIIQFLTVTMDKVGQYIIFILMLLQIGGSAGTFPKELTPTFFQYINPFLPLTYSIKGFRELMSTTVDYTYVLNQALILALIGLTFITLTILYLTITVRKQSIKTKEIAG
ncbi:YhgE/Pip family protein [Paenibacillus sp. NPDC056722]|uniref:YhgE/Pip family protein n=1 Tax=Paenibacillus sp. NPDC056722 TaxID=3345924 RepID=UPI00367DB160